MVRVAAGEPLSIPEGGIAPTGHSIEARVYAEDPAKNFMPAPGTISELVFPSGEGIRVDSGAETGSRVTFYYDPMIAKIIATGATREEAIARMQRALAGTRVEGIKTNLPFLEKLFATEDFAAGRISTRYVDENLPRIMA
jgi:acetyl/propionyl-CoA carboxylase alpha subunit